jgi:ribosomal protein S18 acetylase RimI-like enzyme
MQITHSKPEDINEILQLSRAVTVFSSEEVDTVKELFEGYLKSPKESGYNFLSCHEGDELLGYACWGPTSLTRGTVDLYWVATSPKAQGRGVARNLLQQVEKDAVAAGNYLMVIWTSSKAEYEPARKFYARYGCTLSAQLTDFYDHGDDLVIFTKKMQ